MGTRRRSQKGEGNKERKRKAKGKSVEFKKKGEETMDRDSLKKMFYLSPKEQGKREPTPWS